MNLLEAYKEIKKAGERDMQADQAELAALADSHYWQVLKEAVLIPKIADLSALYGNVSLVETGQMTEEEFGKVAVKSRFVIEHLKDIIDRVENAHGRLEEDDADRA
jgi:hypothetical protein